MSDGEPDEARWLLALDTSTDWAGVALTDGTALAELNWTAGRRQTTQVMPEVQEMLRRMGVEVESLGAVAVAVGPGSFSGLRVGMAIANGIAVATGIPVVGISTLLLTIHGRSGPGGPIVGVIRAGRSRYGWASADELARPATGTIGDLVDFVRVQAAGLVAGELSEPDAIRIRELTGAIVPPSPDRLRRAGTLAQLGWEQWQSGELDPAQVLEPIYLHRT